MATVSVLGLGAMGSALARTLLANGDRVTVWNRSPDKAAALVEAGATLAAGPAEAIAASPASIVCIKSHDDTLRLLEPLAGTLDGRTIIELSTGAAADAEALAAFLGSHAGGYLIGMINSFPTRIGHDDTAILTVGPSAVWEQHGPTIRALGGSSAHLGAGPAALAAMFAALFTTRQGFMFGMIYGALVCRKAGIPMQTFVDQIPLTMQVMQDYYAVFAESVPAGRFEDPPASIATYVAAYDDALATFRATGARADLLELLNEQVQRGAAAGFGDKQLTALVEVLDRD